MTRYIHRFTKPGDRSYLEDGDEFTFVAHISNLRTAVLEVGFCSGEYPILDANCNQPIDEGFLVPGQTYRVRWNADKGGFCVVPDPVNPPPGPPPCGLGDWTSQTGDSTREVAYEVTSSGDPGAFEQSTILMRVNPDGTVTFAGIPNFEFEEDVIGETVGWNWLEGGNDPAGFELAVVNLVVTSTRPGSYYIGPNEGEWQSLGDVDPLEIGVRTGNPSGEWDAARITFDLEIRANDGLIDQCIRTVPVSLTTGFDLSDALPPPPPVTGSELIWPTDVALGLIAGYDINGEIGDNPSNVTLTASPNGMTQTRESSGISVSGRTRTQPEWRNPANEPGTDYEVRLRITAGASFVDPNQQNDPFDTWLTMDSEREFMVAFNNADAPNTVSLAWEFRDTGNDASIRSVPVDVDFSEGADPDNP